MDAGGARDGRGDRGRGVARDLGRGPADGPQRRGCDALRRGSVRDHHGGRYGASPLLADHDKGHLPPHPLHRAGGLRPPEERPGRPRALYLGGKAAGRRGRGPGEPRPPGGHQVRDKAPRRRIVLKHQDLREQVTRVARQMISSGLVTGTSGNVSARTPEGDVLITPSGVGYETLKPEDAVLVDLEKNVLEGSLEPSSETPMHMGIYRARPEVGAVVHTHSRYATTLACLGWEIEPVHYMLTTLSDDGRIPLAPYTTYGTEQLAGYASEALGKRRNACLLQNHGTITVGESAEEAFSRTVILEEMAEIYYRTKIVGEPILLAPRQVEEVAAKIGDYGQSKPLPADTG